MSVPPDMLTAKERDQALRGTVPKKKKKKPLEPRIASVEKQSASTASVSQAPTREADALRQSRRIEREALRRIRRDEAQRMEDTLPNRIVAVERNSGGLLPTKTELAMVNSAASLPELAFMSSRIAKLGDVNPAYVYKTFNYQSYTDPIHGGPLRLSTFTRSLQDGWEAKAIMQILQASEGKQETLTGGIIDTATGMLRGRGKVETKQYRVTATQIASFLLPLTRLAPSVPLAQGLAQAMALAGRDMDPEVFEKNLRVLTRSKVTEGWDHLERVEFAASFAEEGETLENEHQLLNILAPRLAGGAAKARLSRELEKQTPQPLRLSPRQDTLDIYNAYVNLGPDAAAEVANDVFPGFEQRVRSARQLTDELERQVYLDETAFERSWINQYFFEPVGHFYNRYIYPVVFTPVTYAVELAAAPFSEEVTLGLAARRAGEVWRSETRLAEVLHEDIGVPLWIANSMQFAAEWFLDPLVIGGKGLKYARQARVAPSLERADTLRRTLMGMVAPRRAEASVARQFTKDAARFDRSLDSLVASELDDLTTALVSGADNSIGLYLAKPRPWRGPMRSTIERGRTPLPRGFLEDLKRGVQEAKLGKVEAAVEAEQALRSIFTFSSPPSPIVQGALRTAKLEEELARRGLQTAAERFRVAQEKTPVLPRTQATTDLPADIMDDVLPPERTIDLAESHIAQGVVDINDFVSAPLRLEIPTRTRPIPFMGIGKYSTAAIETRSGALARRYTQLRNVNPGSLLKMHEDPDRWFGLRAKRARLTPERVDYYARSAATAGGRSTILRERRLLELDRELQTEVVRNWARVHLPPMADDEIRRLTDEVLTHVGKSNLEANQYLFGTVGGKKLTEPIAQTQLINYYVSVDPLDIEHLLNLAIGQGRRLRNSLRAHTGRIPVASALDWDKSFLDNFLENVGDAYSTLFTTWKRLVVTRPAYMFRVVLGDEGARSLVTIGSLFERLTAQQFTGTRLGLAARKGAAKVGEGMGLLPEGAAALAGLPRTKARAFLERTMADEIVFPDGSVYPIGSAASYAPDFRAVPGYSYEGTGDWLREVQERTDLMVQSSRWDILTPTDDLYYRAWAHHLNDTFQYSPVGRTALQQVALGESRNVTKKLLAGRVRTKGTEESIEAINIGRKAEQVDEWVSKYTDMVYSYTLGDPDIARAALRQAASEDLLKALPHERLPDIHGPLIENIAGKKGLLNSAVEGWTNAWVKNPETWANRIPYTNVWKRRAEKTMARMARDQGLPLTDELKSAIRAASDDFAIAHTRAVMFDFTENSRLGELLGTVVPFLQPFTENIAVWGHMLLRRDPALLGHVKVMYDNAQESGFITRDETTGEQVIPLDWFFFGIPTMLMAKMLPGDVWGLSTPLASLNMFYNNTFNLPVGGGGAFPLPTPGTSPWIGGIAQAMFQDTDDPTLYDYLFQFGPGPVDAEGNFSPAAYVTSFLPTYMERAMQAMFPGVQEGITRSTEMDMLRAQQVSGHELSIPRAKGQARTLAWFKVFFGLFSPGSTIINYPHSYLEDEYHQLVDKHGYDKAADIFNGKYPDYSLITTGKTFWAKEYEGENLPRIPPTDFAVRLLRQPGFKEFANSIEGQPWAWALMAGREGKFDFQAYASQVASGDSPYKSLKEFLKDGEQRAFFETLWPAMDGFDRRIDRKEDKGLQAEADAIRQEKSAFLENLWGKYPLVAPDYIDEKRGSENEVIGYEIHNGGGVQTVINEANVRTVLKNPYFMSTEVGQGLKEYWELRTETKGELEAAGYRYLKDPFAGEIRKNYREGVKAVIEKHPEFQTAYDYFFRGDLSTIETPADRRLRAWQEAPEGTPEHERWVTYQRAMTEIDTLSHRASDQIRDVDRTELFQERRAAIDSLIDQGKGWVLKTWWGTLSAGERRTETYSLATLPLEFWSRFDLEQIGGIKLTNRAAQWVREASSTGLLTARSEEQDASNTSSPFFEARDKYVQQHLGKDPTFDAWVRSANDAGYTIELLRLTEGDSRAAHHWQQVVKLANESRRVAFANEWGGLKIPGEFDSDDQRNYEHLQDIMEDRLTRFADNDENFKKQMLDLQGRSNRGEPLVNYLVPDIYFGPIGGKFDSPRQSAPPKGDVKPVDTTPRREREAGSQLEALVEEGGGSSGSSGGGGGFSSGGGGSSGGAPAPTPAESRTYSPDYTLKESGGRLEKFRSQLAEALANGNTDRAQELREKIKAIRKRLRRALEDKGLKGDELRTELKKMLGGEDAATEE